MLEIPKPTRSASLAVRRASPKVDASCRLDGWRERGAAAAAAAGAAGATAGAGAGTRRTA
jgi:hypothetical protein